MTIDDFIVPQAEWVRIVASTRATVPEVNAMIGKEFPVDGRNFETNSVLVRSASGILFGFNASDVRTLTPLSFNGRRIAVGDIVSNSGTPFVVYGYEWYDGEFHVLCVLEGDFDKNCYRFSMSRIHLHRPSNRTAEDVLAALSDADRKIVEEWVKGK